jgi:hypothetical protein
MESGSLYLTDAPDARNRRRMENGYVSTLWCHLNTFDQAAEVFEYLSSVSLPTMKSVAVTVSPIFRVKGHHDLRLAVNWDMPWLEYVQINVEGDHFYDIHFEDWTVPATLSTFCINSDKCRLNLTKTLRRKKVADVLVSMGHDWYLVDTAAMQQRRERAKRAAAKRAQRAHSEMRAPLLAEARQAWEINPPAPASFLDRIRTFLRWPKNAVRPSCAETRAADKSAVPKVV